jgi:hypothetical protein
MRKPNEAVKDPKASIRFTIFTLGVLHCFVPLSGSAIPNWPIRRDSKPQRQSVVFRWHLPRVVACCFPSTPYNGSLERPVTIVVVVANKHVLSEVFLGIDTCDSGKGSALK